jgi:tetratricopeptide (TPR) repeat protein
MTMRGQCAVLWIGVSLLLATSVAGAPARRQARTRAPVSRAGPRSAASSRVVVAGVLSLIVDRVWEHGDYYWHNGRFADRIATDELVIRMDPGFLEAYSTTGFLLENTGKDEQALAIYRQATQAAPQDWNAWHELGWYYWKRKRVPEAIRIYEVAITKKGAPTTVWKTLAHCYEANGQFKKALAVWEKVRYRDAADGAIYPNMERLERKLKEQEARGERG